jgi:very-short-patch-repair endonuclease
MARRKKHKYMSEVKHIRYDEHGEVISQEVISKTTLIKKKYDPLMPHSMFRCKQSKDRAKQFKSNHRDPEHPERWFYDLLIKALKASPKFIKFPKTQVPIFYTSTNYYILDIFFDDKKICVELDGKCHDKQLRYDKRRDATLAKQGIRTIRLKFSDCFKNPYKEIGKVLDEVSL